MNKRVLGNSIIYTINDLLLKAFSFLLLPLYTAYLTTDSYGTTNLVNSFNAVANYVVVFSLFSAVSRFYVDYREDREKTKRFFGTMITFSFVSGFGFVGLFVVFNQIFTALFFKGIPFFPVALVSLIGLVFSCVYTMYSRILYAMQDAKRISIASMSYFFVQLGFTLLFVVKLQMGAFGVVLATMIASFLYCVFLVIDLKKRDLITFCIDKPILKETLHYSIPIIPHNLSTNIAQFASKVFLNNGFALSTVGLFGLASQFGTLTDTVQSSVNAAFQPWFFSEMQAEESRKNGSISKMAYTICWACGLVFLLIALFSQEVILLFLNHNYMQAWTVVPLCAVTFAIKSAYYPYINLLFYEKRASRLIFTTTLTSSLVNIGLSAVMIPLWGMYGSVLADIIAMCIRVGIAVYIARKYNTIGFHFLNFLKIVLIVIVCIGAGLIFSYTKWVYEVNILNIAYKALIVLIYAAIVGFANKNVIKRYIKKFRARKA